MERHKTAFQSLHLTFVWALLLLHGVTEQVASKRQFTHTQASFSYVHPDIRKCHLNTNGLSVLLASQFSRQDHNIVGRNGESLQLETSVLLG